MASLALLSSLTKLAFKKVIIKADVESYEAMTEALKSLSATIVIAYIGLCLVLELPFRSETDVLIEETRNFFCFIVPTDDNSGDNMKAHTIQIYPGVTKPVIRGDDLVESPLTELELDLRRFRLPASTLPGMAIAAFSDGELVVTVPKGPHEDDDEDGDIGAEHLVFV
nr:Heat shock 22 protein [Ipomoea batatas]